MGFLSKLGGAIKEGLRNGAINGILSSTGFNSVNGQVQHLPYEYDEYGNIIGVNQVFANDLAERYGSSSNDSKLYDGITNSFTKGATSPRNLENNKKDYNPSKYDTANKKDNVDDKLINYGKTYSDSEKQNKIEKKIKYDDKLSDIYTLKVPNWTYADFINERAAWQKGISSILDEPGWFYFKIFFDFDTNHGLFGGLLNDNYLHSATNSAAKYLYSIRNLHPQIKAKDRITALYKFASILSYINMNAPWYFKSINGLDKAILPVINEFSKERSIELEFNVDAVDMRLTTLMSLLSYACYDNLLNKEVIPENLRKFNMTVVLFQSPLRYLHTSYTSRKSSEFLGISSNNIGLNNMLGMNNKFDSVMKYKTMNLNHNEYAMSMKLISFYGCEFNLESFGSIIPSSVSNESPFQLGKNTVKISYVKATEHTMNEFYSILFGSDGFYFSQYSNYQAEDAKYNGYFNKLKESSYQQKKRYDALKSTFDNMTQGGSILGIIDAPKHYTEAIDATEAVMNGLGDDKNLITSLGVNFALGLLGSSRNTNQTLGNIYGDYGVNSAYYKDKLEMLKNGVHERTQAPYYYDPYTGNKRVISNSKNYTAYNYKNDRDTINRFNLTNWLNSSSTNLGSDINNNLR